MIVAAGSLPARVEADLRAAVARIRAPGTQPERIASALYADWYARMSPGGDGRPGRSILETLRAAHAGAREWEDGWVAREVSPAGRVVAAHGSRRRVLDPIDYCNPARPGLAPAPAEPLLVTARRDSVTMQPGFWLTWSGAGPGPASWAGKRIRLYWHVRPEGAAALVHAVTERLKAAGVPYSLKLPTDVLGYRRADAGVLFLPGAAFGELAPVLRAAHAEVAPWLDEPTPALTLPLAGGLGLAEDPAAPEESFGTHRCGILAGAALASLRRSETSEEQLLDAVIEGLAAAGIPPDRPHLGSTDGKDYAW